MSSRGTVLMVADYAAPYSGNFIASQVAVAAAVRDRLEMDFEFVLPLRAAKRAWVQGLQQGGATVSFLPDLPSVEAARRLRQLASARSARIIHSHFTGYDLHCSAAAAGRDVRVLWHIRNGLWGYSRKQRIKDLVKVRLLGKGCDLVVANSEQTGRDSRLRGFPPEKVAVVLNGIVLARFEGPAPDQVGGQPPDRRPARPLTVLAFCWEPARKGADVLIEAMSRLERRAPGAGRLVVVGEERLRRYLDERLGGAPPEWLQIQAPVDDVPALLASADVFVSASREDAFSYAIGEAMAAGLPVVSSDIPGPAHYFAALGLSTYPVEDPDALADNLQFLLESDQRAELGEENRSFVRANLGVERHVDALVTLYASLLRET